MHLCPLLLIRDLGAFCRGRVLWRPCHDPYPCLGPSLVFFLPNLSSCSPRLIRDPPLRRRTSLAATFRRPSTAAGTTAPPLRTCWTQAWTRCCWTASPASCRTSGWAPPPRASRSSRSGTGTCSDVSQNPKTLKPDHWFGTHRLQAYFWGKNRCQV
jgi:hypothetical protein